MPSAQQVMDSLIEVSKPSLFKEATKWFDYKGISLEKVRSDVIGSGDWAEFGVFTGDCAKVILSQLPKDVKLYLIDSFEGVPEDWLGDWKKGTFALEEKDIPVFADPRVKTVKGFFKDSLPGYFSPSAAPLAYVHMDADLYSSTWDVLRHCNHVIAPGIIILFDEYLMYGTDDEHRALVEWAEEFAREFIYLWCTQWVQVAIRITK